MDGVNCYTYEIKLNHYHKLALDLETAVEIREILSEGEQRAIAIGSFLAELRTGNHDGAIVFDDPVSSLDHFRRQNVARRLADLAKARQVIVFTHDSSFLGELCDLIESNKIDHTIHHLEWEGAHSGKVVQGLPWLHQSFKERIDKLQQAQRKLSKVWPAYPNDADSAAMRTQYSLLRATVERVIQDVVSGNSNLLLFGQCERASSSPSVFFRSASLTRLLCG